MASADQLAYGNLEHVIDTSREDELGSLAKSFSDMRDAIRKKVSDLHVLNNRIEEQNEKLKQADKIKDEFLANTSHELRTPLNGIIGIADSLIDGDVGDLTGKQQYNLSLIASSGRRLTNLINDILDFTKLKEHDIQLRLIPLDMRSITELILMLSKTLVGGKEIQLANQIGADLPAVQADENRVQQILHNLVGNAVKFTETGMVSVSAIIQDEQLAITVSDTGIGIPQNSLERIFESFEQADGSTARQYG
ncbi:MAG: HAMP domain-containing protein, partial [Fuerstiella sp.]|nr:HAMP domain-containing protein [Fuerstiella sp.]